MTLEEIEARVRKHVPGAGPPEVTRMCADLIATAEADLRERLAAAIEELAPAAPHVLSTEMDRQLQTRRGAMLDSAHIVRERAV